MRVAIYAEGRSDLAVLTNILKGYLNIDQSDIQYELPEYYLDQTDLAEMKVEEFSNWTIVKDHCVNSEKIDIFFNTFDDDRFAIVQIDTAERNLPGFDVKLPSKHGISVDKYCIELRANVIAKINEWLGNFAFEEKIKYAIAIEEIEAWVLTIYVKGNTAKFNNPKKKLYEELNRQLNKRELIKLSHKKSFDKYFDLTRKFRKRKDLVKYSSGNESLFLFLDSLNN